MMSDILSGAPDLSMGDWVVIVLGMTITIYIVLRGRSGGYDG
jgi:hypothetical protein